MAKVSVYVDDEVWTKFRAAVFRKHGTLRKLSNELEALLRTTLVEDHVTSGFAKLGVKADGTLSAYEMKAKRPLSRGPPAEQLVRAMRQKRIAKALSRQ